MASPNVFHTHLCLEPRARLERPTQSVRSSYLLKHRSSRMASDLTLVGFMASGVILSFILDPTLSYLRTQLARMSPTGNLGGGGVGIRMQGPPAWWSKYKCDFGFALILMVVSLALAILVYAFGARPTDPLGALSAGFLWNSFLDKLTGKVPFSSVKPTSTPPKKEGPSTPSN